MARAKAPTDASGEETLKDARDHGSAQSVAFERFEVEKELGKGGMAVVFRARDSETGDKVALKQLTGNLDDAGRVRFAREVRAASRLAHENICRVIAVGEKDSRPFLAMELVRGANLADIAKRGPANMPARIAAAVMAQLFDALAHAHAAGVLHRDLKPANVMLTPDGVIKLLDFGIAKSVDDETVTKTGALVGTPAFMAPEQVKLEAVDHRADLFSAGMLLLAFLRQNRHRFHGKKLDSTQMLIRVALEPTPPLLEEAPHAPVALDNLIAGLTALDPKLRFADALAAKAALLDSGLVPEDPRALLARFIEEPIGVSAELNAADARAEIERAHGLKDVEGGAPAAALALARASLLDPASPAPAERDALCQAHGFTFTEPVDEKSQRLLVDIHKDPQSAALLKRASDVLKSKGQLRLHAAYLWRYVRARPDDALALTQLRTLLDGPEPADEGAKSSARLSTRSIVAGIKTGGLKAAPRLVTQRKDPTALLLASAPTLQPLAPPMAIERGPATVVFAGSRDANESSGRGRTIAAALVAGAVVLAAVAFVQSFGSTTPATGAKDAVTHGALLMEADAALANDAARALALASQVIDNKPTPPDGRAALWIRARAHAALGDKDSARADADLYLARTTDFHDPHLQAVKRLLAELGAGAPR